MRPTYRGIPNRHPASPPPQKKCRWYLKINPTYTSLTRNCRTPLTQHPVNRCDRRLQLMSMSASGFVPYCVSQLHKTFGPWILDSFVEPVPKEVKTLACRVNNTGLFRMQRQAGLCRPRLHHLQRRMGFLGTSTQDHKIIRITHHLHAVFHHQVIQGVKVNVA